MTPELATPRAPRRIRIEPPDGFRMDGSLVPLNEGEPATVYEDRMAAQRKEWRDQDTARYRNPDFNSTDLREYEWRCYAWNGRKWKLVGTRPVRRNRRKPMTMNRLFAGIRRALGLRAHVPVRLVTAADDERRIARGFDHFPPQHVPNRRSHLES